MLGILTGNERTNLINKEMSKDLLTLAFINPELTLDEDNPETGKPYRFLDVCLITEDIITSEVRAAAETHLNVKGDIGDTSVLKLVSYVNSIIYDVVKDYLELLKSQESITVNGESGTFKDWSEVMYQRLTQEEIKMNLPEMPHLKYIMISDENLFDIYDYEPEEK